MIRSGSNSPRNALLRLDLLRDLAAAAVQTAHDRALLRAKGACGLAVGQAKDVDRHHRLAQRHAQPLECLVHRPCLDGAGDDRVIDRQLMRLVVLKRHGHHAPRAGGADPGIAQHAQQVSKIVFAPEEPWSTQYPFECVLNEILRGLPGTAQAVRRPV